MVSAHDFRNAENARRHIGAAQAAPHRKDLELTQAEALARLIADPMLRADVMREIEEARDK